MIQQLLAAYGAAVPASVPVASFTNTPTAGAASLSVAFTDTSTNSPTSWLWERTQDGVNWSSFSTAKNPTASFAAGAWAVRLTATNAAGSDTHTDPDAVVSTTTSGTVTFDHSAVTGLALIGRWDVSGSNFRAKGSKSAVAVRFRGTDCTIKAGGGGGNPFDVSVDGGGFTNPALTGAGLVVAAGLTDAWHTAYIAVHSGYTPGFAWFTEAADTVSVTGTAPGVQPDPAYGTRVRRIFGGDADTDGYWPTDNVSGSNGSTAPAYAYGYGGESFRFRAKVESGKAIYAMVFDGAGAALLYLRTDGAIGPAVALGGLTRAALPVGTGDGNWHDYVLVGSRGAIIDGVLIGGINSRFDTTAVTPKAKIFDPGDSVTAGQTCSADANYAQSWPHQYGKQTDSNTINFGEPGITTQGWYDARSTYLGKVGTAPDKIVVYLGYNDGGAAVSAKTSLLNALIAAYPGVPIKWCKLTSNTTGADYSANNAGTVAAAAACSAPSQVTVVDTAAITYAPCGADVLHPGAVPDADHPDGAGGGKDIATAFVAAGV